MKDILHTADGDIDFTTGDLQTATTDCTTGQHKCDILLSAPGDFKEAPTAGVGAVEYLNDENPGLFLRVVRQELGRDGMKVEEVRMQGGELKITGEYGND